MKYYRSTVDRVHPGPFARKGGRIILVEVRSYTMQSLSKWVGAVMIVVLLAGGAKAANTIVPGTVKSINADKKTFLMNDHRFTDKEYTIHVGDDTIINRDGKESKTDLKVGDTVNVFHDNGTLTWTAHYILVREGVNKDTVLRLGTVKRYADDKKELVFTDAEKKEWTFPVGDAKVRLNKAEGKYGDLKLGDHFLAIIEMPKGEKESLKAVMVERK
jgi:hypothetical protein